MKSILFRYALSIAFLLANLPVSVNAGKPLSNGGSTTATPLQQTYSQYNYGIVNIIEQQTIGGRNQTDPSMWVSNGTIGEHMMYSIPEKCVWSYDDQRKVEYSGYLEPGQSVTYTDCVISDWTLHLSRASAIFDQGSSIELSVTADDMRGHVVTVKAGAPVLVPADKRTYKGGQALEARVGVFSHTFSNAYPYFDLIPNSGTGPNSKISGVTGGVGVRTKLSFTIKNTGTTRIPHVTWVPETIYQYAQDIYSWCPNGLPSISDKTNCRLRESDTSIPQVCWCKAGYSEVSW